MTRVFWLALVLVIVCSPVSRGAISISFDYSFDTNSFFGPTTAARTTLEAAGSFFEGILGDSLDAITPSPGNTWSLSFTHPTAGTSATVSNPTIPADTIVVYVGARSLSGSTIGLAETGYTASASSAGWFDEINNRGGGTTTGPMAVDYAPWGGALTLDTDSTWHFDPSTAVPGGVNDGYSVILHELGHLLGVGLADRWDNLSSSGSFTGTNATTVFGGPVPVSGGHWTNGVESFIFPSGAIQEAAMDPSIVVGTRKLFTQLDVAALKDLGWEIAAIPEPSSAIFLSLAALLLTGKFVKPLTTWMTGMQFDKSGQPLSTCSSRERTS